MLGGITADNRLLESATWLKWWDERATTDALDEGVVCGKEDPPRLLKESNMSVVVEEGADSLEGLDKAAEADVCCGVLDSDGVVLAVKVMGMVGE